MNAYKTLTGIKAKSDVLEMGIDKYNEECRSIVMRYSKEWENIVHRLGRWIDFEVRGSRQLMCIQGA